MAFPTQQFSRFLLRYACWCGLLIFFLNAYHPSNAENKREQKIYTAAVFGPNDRLWRVIPAQNSISVDYSTDYGKTFSAPVRINPQDQAINLWDENPPSIAVDKNGRIYVIYSADDRQKNTVFFSWSENGGVFSTPLKISTQAEVYYHYQAELLIDAEQNLHLIWHDVRDRAEYQQTGLGDLSIYHTSAKTAALSSFAPEQRIAKNICSCCRTAMAADTDGNPVILARFVFPGNIRDHGLIKLDANGTASAPLRVTYDNWQIEGCPTQGPSLAIDPNGRYHIAWFSLGKQRTGIFYAWSDDQGQHFSEPLALGNPAALPARADVYAQYRQVALAWKEFDGLSTRIVTMHSEDSGEHWSPPRTIAETQTQSAHPALIGNGEKIFLSWSSLDKGYQLLPVN